VQRAGVGKRTRDDFDAARGKFSTLGRAPGQSADAESVAKGAVDDVPADKARCAGHQQQGI
jgi:hypothetical protein